MEDNRDGVKPPVKPGVMERVQGVQIIEAPQHHTVLPVQYVGNLKKAIAIPSIKNVEKWKAGNTAPITITDFADGQNGQEIQILGDGQTSVAHNTRIKTTSGVTRLLAAEKVYKFTRYANIWYEQDTSGTTSSGAPTAGGLATHLVSGTVKTDITESDPVVYTKVTVDGLLAGKSDDNHDHEGTYVKIAGDVMLGSLRGPGGMVQAEQPYSVNGVIYGTIFNLGPGGTPVGIVAGGGTLDTLPVLSIHGGSVGVVAFAGNKVGDTSTERVSYAALQGQVDLNIPEGAFPDITYGIKLNLGINVGVTNWSGTAYGIFSNIDSSFSTPKFVPAGALYGNASFVKGHIDNFRVAAYYAFAFNPEYANTLAFYAASGRSVFLDKIGVGTLTPAEMIDVVGDIQLSGDFKRGGVIIEFGADEALLWAGV